MSRYEIVNQSLTLVVGWDRGLQTFFGHLDDADRPAGEEELLWVGTTPEALPTVAALTQTLEPYWTLDEETCADLAQDQAHQAPLTPLQRQMLAFLTDYQGKRSSADTIRLTDPPERQKGA